MKITKVFNFCLIAHVQVLKKVIKIMWRINLQIITINLMKICKIY